MKISILLLIILILVSFSGCSSQGPIPRGSELTFEKVSMHSNDLARLDKLPIAEQLKQKIIIISDNQSFTEQSVEPHILRFISQPPPLWIPYQVDFSDYFLIEVFFGKASGGIFLKVTDIWQETNTVFIRAQFIFKPEGGIAMTWYADETMLVKRTSLHQFGELTFKLVDDYGKERAVTTANIPPP